MLMKHDEHGFKDAVGIEVEDMKKNGWYEYSYEQLKVDIANKHKKPDNTVQSKDVNEGTPAQPSGTQEPEKRRGRPKGV